MSWHERQMGSDDTAVCVKDQNKSKFKFLNEWMNEWIGHVVVCLLAIFALCLMRAIHTWLAEWLMNNYRHRTVQYMFCIRDVCINPRHCPTKWFLRLNNSSFSRIAKYACRYAAGNALISHTKVSQTKSSGIHWDIGQVLTRIANILFSLSFS